MLISLQQQCQERLQNGSHWAHLAKSLALVWFICSPPGGMGNLPRCPMAKEARWVSEDTQVKHMKHKHGSYSWKVTGEAHRLCTNTAASSACPGCCRANLSLPISGAKFPQSSMAASAPASNGGSRPLGRCDPSGLLWQAGPVKSRVFLAAQGRALPVWSALVKPYKRIALDLPSEGQRRNNSNTLMT